MLAGVLCGTSGGCHCAVESALGMAGFQKQSAADFCVDVGQPGVPLYAAVRSLEHSFVEDLFIGNSWPSVDYSLV